MNNPCTMAESDSTSFGSEQPLWVENVALALGRLFALTSVVLVVIWATGQDTNNGFLGGLDWNENVFNWHPVFMVVGVLCCTGWSITAFRNKMFGYTTSRYLHVCFHLGAKICLTIGIRAVWQSKDDSHGDHNPHVYTLHAWLGLTTTLLLFQNDILGGFSFLLPYVSVAVKKLYTPYHIFFGKMAFVMAVVTIETGAVVFNITLQLSTALTSLHIWFSGIMEKNIYVGCIPDLEGEKDTTPGSHYAKIPTGCRVSNGLGLTVMLCLLFLLFALRNKKLKLPPPKDNKSSRSSKTSFAGTLLSPLFSSSRNKHENKATLSGDTFDGAAACPAVGTRMMRPSVASSEDLRPRASSIA
jgi:cytochrome b-561